MKLGVLYSSGKDSTFALWYYLEQGWDVCCLLSLLPENPDSYMFQNPSKYLLEKQADCFNLPLLLQGTKGEKEKELEDLRALLENAKAEYKIEAVAVGALASDYQHERVNRICQEIGLKTFAPLWHKNQEQLMRDMISSGFDVRMTRIAADGLTEDWLGKPLGEEDIDKLLSMNGIAVAGEGGEFETIVLDGPIFKEPIHIEFEKVMESENRGELKISISK